LFIGIRHEWFCGRLLKRADIDVLQVALCRKTICQ